MHLKNEFLIFFIPFLVRFLSPFMLSLWISSPFSNESISFLIIELSSVSDLIRIFLILLCLFLESPFFNFLFLGFFLIPEETSNYWQHLNNIQSKTTRVHTFWYGQQIIVVKIIRKILRLHRNTVNIFLFDRNIVQP